MRMQCRHEAERRRTHAQEVGGFHTMPAITTSCRRQKKKGVGRWVGRVVEPNLAGALDRTRSSSQWRRQARCAQAVYLVEFAGRAVVVARQEHAAERVAEGLNQAEVPRHEGPRRRRLHQMQLVQCAAVQQEEEGERGGERPSPIIHHALARSNRWGERRKEKKKERRAAGLACL